jgi:glycosyltransferase involved in cell wall biosynthesis
MPLSRIKGSGLSTVFYNRYEQKMNKALPHPRVSIIIATYNAACTLERCFESVIGQTLSSWELLVADGGSTDDTVSVIERYKNHISYWHSHADQGIYDAWNQALQKATGEYVCFLGADDAWSNSAVLSMLFDAINGAEYDLVTSRGCVFDPGTGKQVLYGAEWNYQKIGRRMVVCHPGMLTRRDLFLRYGNFDTSYRIAGDLDFLLRLPSDVRALYVDRVTVVIEAAGISRMNVIPRLREQRRALSQCPRYGVARAYLVWLDKLWRYPIAKLFDISH